jgi:putative salt-induced outer membrane protein YdiY
MSGKISIFAVAILVLRSFALGAQAPAPRAAAAAPAAPATPATPAAGDAQKPAGDALAVEAESKGKEPEDKDEKDKTDKKEAPRLTGNFAAGLTLTKGNSDTRTFNLALALEYRSRPRNLVKADGFYLNSREEGVSSVARTSAHLRDEYSVSSRYFAFADLQFLKDQFKSIDSLVASTVGAGIFLVKNDKEELSADLGAGVITERDEGLDRTTSGVVRAGESYRLKISKSANLVENAFALWKTRDLADGYYHFELALGAAVNDHAELKIALLDEFKNKPPFSTIKKNDLAGIVSIGYKL